MENRQKGLAHHHSWLPCTSKTTFFLKINLAKHPTCHKNGSLRYITSYLRCKERRAPKTERRRTHISSGKSFLTALSWKIASLLFDSFAAENNVTVQSPSAVTYSAVFTILSV